MGGADPGEASSAAASVSAVGEFLDGESSRFESKVFRAGGPEACHPWLGAISSTGHGKFQTGSKLDGTAVVVTAHRWVYERENGPVPGLHVRHDCDEYICQNPRHLVIGTTADNSEDYVRRRHRTSGPLVDVRGPAGRGRAIRAAILSAPNDAAALVAWQAAAAAGDPQPDQLHLWTA